MPNFIKKYFNKRKRIKLYPIMTKLSLELEASKTETTSFYYYESLLKEFNDKFQALYKTNLYDYPRLNRVDYHIQQAIFFCELCTHLLDKYTKENCWDSLLQSDKEKLADFLIKSKNLALDAIKELTNIMQDMIGYEPEKESS